MLPPVDNSLLPADVRAAGPRGRQLYAAALGFEQQLVTQLTQQLAQSAQPQDDESDGESDDASDGDAGTSMYTSMLPDAMAQGMTASGGIGLADQLFRVLNMGDAASPPAPDPSQGGDAPGAGEAS